MTRRGTALLGALLTSAFMALSFGSRLSYFLCLLLAVLFVYAFFSCLWAKATLKAAPRLSQRKVQRGENADLILTLSHRGLLPVGAFAVRLDYAGKQEECYLPGAPFVEHELEKQLFTRHVGQYTVRMERIFINDLFGLLRMKKRIRGGETQLFVLPNPFEIEKPRPTLGDDGAAALSRTQEDYNAPEDVRAYQPGDAMKRVHWKLSLRKRELLVRRFETPAPPDTLILLDCAAPRGGADAEATLSLRDALCETAVAVAKLQMDDGSPVRLPLYGEKATEFFSDQPDALPLLKDMLCAQPFFKGEDFAGVLNLELRRMRRTGAAIIITTRLDAQIVEGVSHIRRMGPSARLYLATYTPDAPEYQPFVTRLQHHLVEVCYVTPA